MNQDDQGDEKLQRSITRAREKWIKDKEDQVVHELMIATEQTLKDSQSLRMEALKMI